VEFGFKSFVGYCSSFSGCSTCSSAFCRLNTERYPCSRIYNIVCISDIGLRSHPYGVTSDYRFSVFLISADNIKARSVQARRSDDVRLSTVRWWLRRPLFASNRSESGDGKRASSARRGIADYTGSRWWSSPTSWWPPEGRSDARRRKTDWGRRDGNVVAAVALEDVVVILAVVFVDSAGVVVVLARVVFLRKIIIIIIII